MSHSNNSNTGANPFLAPYDTPFGAIPYDRITLEDYIPAIKEAIRNEKESIDAICNNSEPATFENTIVALDRSGLLLGEIIGAFNAMSNAQSNDEILAIEEEIEHIVKEHAKRNFDILTSIPGIGKKTACLFIAMTDSVKRFDNYKQVISYFGMSPRTYDSGTSVHSKAKICKSSKRSWPPAIGSRKPE